MLQRGVCILVVSKRYKFYVDSFYGIELKSKPKSYLHKQLLAYYKKGMDICKDLPNYKTYNKIVIIEDCWMGFNPWTTKVLAKCAALSFLIFQNWADNIPIPISPVSARCKVGFKKDRKSKIKLKEQIQIWIENNFDLIIEDNNLADSFVLALVGLLENNV